jgi:hypothetical protein
MPYVYRADSFPACNFQTEIIDPRNAVDIVQHFLHSTLITYCGAFSLRATIMAEDPRKLLAEQTNIIGDQMRHY